MYFRYLANSLSLFRIAIAYPFYLAVINGEGLSYLILAGVSDVLDGMFARRTEDGENNKLGRFLDPFCDKVFLFGAVFAWYQMETISGILFAAICFRELALGFLALIVLKRKKVFVASLPIGKWVFGGLLVLIGTVLVGWIPEQVISWLFSLYMVTGLLYFPLYRSAFK